MRKCQIICLGVILLFSVEGHLSGVSAEGGRSEPPPEEIFELTDFIVTARGFADPAQKVPVSLFSLDGDLWDTLLVEDLEDLGAYIPNVEIQEQSPNTPSYAIRGITSDSSAPNAQPRVSVFQDGVSLSRTQGSQVELFDIDRVEVLRGPQGTLFGRAAQIGAIHIIRNKPTHRATQSLKASIGSDRLRRLEGHLNIPLKDDEWALRLAGKAEKRDGFVTNIAGGDLNGKGSLAGRIGLLWEPNDGTRVDLMLDFQEDDYPGTAFESGAYPVGAGGEAFGDTAGLNRGEDLFIEREVGGATLAIEHRLSDRFSLRATTGFRSFDSHEEFDADGTLAYYLEFGEIASGDQFSQEFRLLFEGEHGLRAVFGAGLFQESADQNVLLRTDERSVLSFAGLGQPLIGPDGLPVIVSDVNPVTGQPLNPNYTESFEASGETRSVDLFLDGQRPVGEHFELGLGLRGSLEKLTSGFKVINNPNPFFDGSPGFALPASKGEQSDEATFTSAVGHLALKYKIDARQHIYAVLSRGRRPNVINADNDGTDILEDEIVWSYELGYKARLREGRVILEATAFHYDYSNFQTSVFELGPGGSFVAQVEDSGQATAWGAEFQAKYRFSEQVFGFLSAGWLDASFDDEDASGQAQALAGNRFRLSPEYSLALGLTLRQPIGRSGELFLSPSYSWKSQVFFEEDNQPGLEQGDFGLLHARLGYRWNNGRYEIAAFAHNLLDTNYLIDGGNTGNSFGLPTFVAGSPRVLGVEVKLRY